MKVHIGTKALLKVLKFLKKVVPSFTPKPVLTCIRITTEDGVVVLAATNLDTGCRYRIPDSEVMEEGRALIPFGKLYQIVNSQKGTEITLSSEGKDGEGNWTCVVAGKKAKYNLYSYDPAEYPSVTPFGSDYDVMIAPDVLTELIAKTSFAIAKEHSRYAISGALWEVTDKMKMVCTDGCRLAIADGSIIAQHKAFSTIASAKFVNLIPMAIKQEKYDSVHIRTEDDENFHFILVKCGCIELYAHRVEGNFPKYKGIIPPDFEHTVEMDRKELLETIEQASIMMAREDNSRIVLKFSKELLTVSAKDLEAGMSEVVMRIDYKDKEMDIGFNPNSLKDVLKIYETDTIVFKFNDPFKPILISSGEDFRYLLMPMDLEA